MKNNLHLSDYERLDAVRNSKKISSWLQFSKEIGLKSSQIFSDIRVEKCKISRALASRICNKFPEFSFLWVMTGDGDMLKSDGIIQSATIDGDNSGIVNTITTATDADRLLALLEAEKDEKRRLLAIIENLINK